MAKVKRLVLGLFAVLAACVVALGVPGEGSAASLAATMTRVTSSGVTVTDNVSDNNYSVYYASTMKSYLYENEDGGYTRVEYTSSGVVVEEYSSTFALESTKILDLELSRWGGFYCGSDYNYLVFGQSNYDEDDSVEVVRVVKYTKDWTRVSACSIYGANTYVPFRSGSCRMTEVGGSLYVYSCHTMYASSGGSHHQANMTFVIDEDSMEVTYSCYSIMNNNYGYVSHSFNQFIQTDGTYVYRVDHGDAYPRGIYLSRMTDGASVTRVTYATIYSILGTTGTNATGVSIGGMELSTDNVLVAGNSVDMSDSDSYSASGTRNIFVTVTDKSVSSTSTAWFTSYDSDDGVTVRTPQLVKLDDDSFLLMWEEKGDSITTKLVLIDGDGNAVGEVYELEVRLSDCQPIVDSNGYVTWYVTDGDYVRFYQIDPDNLAGTIVNKDSIEDATVTLGTTSYTYTGSARTPSVTVELSDGTRLTRNTDYTVTYSDNTDAGTATAIITGIGFYGGEATATFTISACSIAYASASLEATSYTYDGTAKEPVASSVTYNSMALIAGTDYTLSYTSNTDAGTAYAVLTGAGNYTGTKKLSFTISAQELDEDNVTLEYATTQYTGSSLKPSATVLNAAGETLTSGTDYSISYSDNKSIGTATVTITGKNNYTGTITKTFTITAQELDAANVTLSATSYTYDGTAKTPTATVTLSGTTLASGTDYTVSYSSNTSVGTATVTVTGTGNYTGTVTKTFAITAAITRLAGESRYGTAAAVAAEYGTSEYIILAAGKNEKDTAYADALAASYAAGVLDCSVVLTEPDALSDSTAEAIFESGASTVIIVGGTAAVSTAVEAELEAMGLEVARIAGETRYETATLIYEEFSGSASGTAILATGQDFPDALSASPLSCAAGWPILLTKSDSLSAATLEALADFDSVVIVGGTSAVSQDVEDELVAMGVTVIRIAGSNRYLTSVEIAEYAIGEGLLSADVVGVATGVNYPDALAGGALVGARGGVLLLAKEESLSGARNSTALAAFLDEYAAEVDQVFLLGGVAAVSASLEGELTELLG